MTVEEEREQCLDCVEKLLIHTLEDGEPRDEVQDDLDRHARERPEFFDQLCIAFEKVERPFVSVVLRLREKLGHYECPDCGAPAGAAHDEGCPTQKMMQYMAEPVYGIDCWVKKAEEVKPDVVSG